MDHPDYPLEIVERLGQDGAGCVYLVRLQGDNPSLFVPNIYLEAGKMVAKVSTSVVSEMNTQFGTQQSYGSIKLRNQMGVFGEEFTITDEAWRNQGRLGFAVQYTDKQGKIQKKEDYLPYAEAMLNENFYSDIEWAMMYGKKSTTKGYNGYIKRTGPGLRQQLSESWLKPLNGPTTESNYKDFLLNVFFNRNDEQDRKVTGLAGTVQFFQFHDAMAAKAASFFTVDSNFIQQTSTNPRHLSYGAQFTHY